MGDKQQWAVEILATRDGLTVGERVPIRAHYFDSQGVERLTQPFAHSPASPVMRMVGDDMGAVERSVAKTWDRPVYAYRVGALDQPYGSWWSGTYLDFEDCLRAAEDTASNYGREYLEAVTGLPERHNPFPIRSGQSVAEAVHISLIHGSAELPSTFFEAPIAPVTLSTGELRIAGANQALLASLTTSTTIEPIASLRIQEPAVVPEIPRSLISEPFLNTAMYDDALVRAVYEREGREAGESLLAWQQSTFLQRAAALPSGASAVELAVSADLAVASIVRFGHLFLDGITILDLMDLGHFEPPGLDEKVSAVSEVAPSVHHLVEEALATPTARAAQERGDALYETIEITMSRFVAGDHWEPWRTTARVVEISEKPLVVPTIESSQDSRFYLIVPLTQAALDLEENPWRAVIPPSADDATAPASLDLIALPPNARTDAGVTPPVAGIVSENGNLQALPAPLLLQFAAAAPAPLDDPESLAARLMHLVGIDIVEINSQASQQAAKGAENAEADEAAAGVMMITPREVQEADEAAAGVMTITPREVQEADETAAGVMTITPREVQEADETAAGVMTITPREVQEADETAAGVMTITPREVQEADETAAGVMTITPREVQEADETAAGVMTITPREAQEADETAGSAAWAAAKFAEIADVDDDHAAGSAAGAAAKFAEIADVDDGHDAAGAASRERGSRASAKSARTERKASGGTAGKQSSRTAKGSTSSNDRRPSR